uniref:Uncharacterized protein n=1 Tax=Hyaloperonospora arabidopsidis (strain Emoy2) TaxID=559515 RepID=M4BRX9_HYAAE
MWMQKSVESSSFSGSHFHDRNRANAPHANGSGVYNGSASTGSSTDTGDWKHKILESGQWLGGKVIEYGGKLTRGPMPDHSVISDHYAQQVPRNDGRANWMADIRSSSTSMYTNGTAAGSAIGGGLAGYSGGYQNDFVTERPKVYAEYSRGYMSTPFPVKKDEFHLSGNSFDGYGQSSRYTKKESKGKKSSKKSKKTKAKREEKRESDSESEREEEREAQSCSESSVTESVDSRRHSREVETKKKKTKKSKTRGGFYSEEGESEGACSTDNASADSSLSCDSSKLPSLSSANQEKVTKKKAKAKKNKNDKGSKKSRTRRQSIASSEDESASRRTSTRKGKTRTNKKAVAAASSVSVDLLGVDLDVPQMVQPATSGCSGQEVQSSVFDRPLCQNPLQELAGLSFSASVQDAALSQSSDELHDTAPTITYPGDQLQSQPRGDAFQTTMLPENDIIDFSALASEKKKALSANPKEKRSLNDMQKARGPDQPTPVMVMPLQGQQQQNVSGSMTQLNMKQLQTIDGATGMPNQVWEVYSSMQMHQIPIQAQMHQVPMQQTHPPMMTMQPQMMMIQPPMSMVTQHQMMGVPIARQQQFARGGAGMARLPNVTTSDGFPLRDDNAK